MSIRSSGWRWLVVAVLTCVWAFAVADLRADVDPDAETAKPKRTSKAKADTKAKAEAKSAEAETKAEPKARRERKPKAEAETKAEEAKEEKARMDVLACLSGALATGFPDSFRDIKVLGKEDLRLSFGGELRVRGEVWENFDFDPELDDEFLTGRALLNADLRYRDSIRLFVEGISAGSTDRDLPGGRRATDVDSADLLNAYVEAALPGEQFGEFRVRGGRQELSYGAQRLISPLDWANTRRTFDGGLVRWIRNDCRLDAFWTRPVEVRRYDFNKADSDTDFFGLYGSHVFHDKLLTLDAYALGLHRHDVAVGELLEDEDRYTVGLRMAGAPGNGLDFDVEGGYQFGELGDADIRAAFLASQIGLTFDETTWTPRAFVGFDYASGDKDPEDDEVRTFNQLFPLGHKYFGYADVVGRQNIVAASTGFSVKPTEKVKAKVSLHHFRRATTQDALYNAAGQIVRTGEESDAKEVGTELDLSLHVTFTPKTSGLIGFSQFWAGDFISETGTDKDLRFFYVSLSQVL